MTSNGWAPIGGEHLNKPAIPPEEPRVFLALPIYGGIEAEFFATLLQSLTRFKSRVQVLQGDSLVPRSRNNLAHEFIHNCKAPFLMFCDVDLVVDPAGLEHLINLPPEYAIVGGCYAKKKIGPAEWVCNPIAGTSPDANGLQEVREMGTGLLRVHRGVFAAIAASYPQLHYTCDGNHDARVDYFPVGTFWDKEAGPEGKGYSRYLSEDWAICQLARAIGYKVWADTKCAARHIGRVTYPFPEPEAPKTEVNAAAPAANNTAAVSPPAVPAAEPVVSPPATETPKPKRRHRKAA